MSFFTSENQKQKHYL